MIDADARLLATLVDLLLSSADTETVRVAQHMAAQTQTLVGQQLAASLAAALVSREGPIEG